MRSSIVLACVTALAHVILPTRAQAQEPAPDGFNPGASGRITAIALQADGKVLVGGDFSGLGGGTGATLRQHIGRLNPDGSVDASFDPGADGAVEALVVQPDGKILVAGSFTMLGGGGTGTTARSMIGRLNSDGSLDTNFNPGANDTISAIALQPDGKILVGGEFTTLGGGGTGTISRNRIGRLNADGSLDTSFDPGADGPGANGPILAIALQPDNRIVVGGAFTVPRSTKSVVGIGRLHPDGDLDTSFHHLIECYYSCGRVTALGIQSTGHIVAGGWFPAFGPYGDLMWQSYLVRMEPDGGLLGNRLNSLPPANGPVHAVVIQPDDQILVGGTFTNLNGVARQNLGRLLPGGSIDTMFNPGTDGPVEALAVQPDGRILVGGDFSMLGGMATIPRLNIGRLPSGIGRLLTVGLGPFSEGGWFATRQESDGHSGPMERKRLPWSAYNASGGGLRLAAGDVDGDGLSEIVAGLGPGNGGWVAVLDDALHGYALLKWIRVPWPDYNARNGEVWPAVGHLDDLDGRAEIVLGLGSGGEGWFAILDDAASNYRLLAWERVAWPAYNASGSGATHPAIGDLDGDANGEIVLGLGEGGNGWIEVFRADASGRQRHRAWLQVEWPTYNAANGMTFPAAGDLDGDRRAEIVAGLGRGGAGWLEVFEDEAGNYEHVNWLRTSWGQFNASGTGETHPAVGNLDQDFRAEIVLGLGEIAGNGGWLEILDDAITEYRSRGWLNVDWAAFRASGGATFPAIGRFK